MIHTLSVLTDISDAGIQMLRTIGGYFMAVIYTFIQYFYEVFEYLARAQILDNDFVQNIYRKVGLILGLFMTFKLIFSLLQSLVNPEKLSDSKQGATAIIKRTIIAIILLGTTPYIFREAYTIQNLIVGGNANDNILYKLIAEKSTSDLEETGRTLSSDLYFDFFKDDESPKLNSGIEDFVSNCKENTGYCDRFKKSNFDSLESSVREGNMSFFRTVDYLSLKDESTGDYIIEFDYGFVGILVGGIVLYMIFMYCIQVAIRIAQLSYLQLVAPIPILSYISNPEGSFKNWVKQCLATFLDLFIRLTIIYFSMTLIVSVIDQINTTGSIIRSSAGLMSNTVLADSTSNFTLVLVKIFIIVGLMLFAKKAPELLKELFPNISGAGKFSFSLGKKTLQETAKGIYDSPIIGWGLKLGKNVGAGIDRKVHGKPFFGRGKLGQAIDKWLPEQAEVRKQKEEAQAAARHREDMLKQGEELFNNYNGDSDALTGAFSSGEYKKSYLALRKAKKDTGEAELELSAAQADLNAAHASGNKEAIRIAKDRLQVATDNLHAMQGNLELAKARHDSNKKIFRKDAEKEDAFKYWKDTHSEIKNYSENMPDLSGQSQQEQINQTLQEILNRQDTNSQPSNIAQESDTTSHIITEEHVQSRPRQETTSTSVQDEYSRLVSQYNGETDPVKKTELRKQIEEFERRH